MPRRAGEPAGVDRVAVEYGCALLRRPVHCGLEKRGPDAGPAVFAAHHEAGHPPRVGIIVKDPGKCPVVRHGGQGRAWHDPRPADRVLIAVGQQADGHLCFLDFTLRPAPVIRLLVPKKPLAPARVRVLLPGSEDPAKLGTPVSSRWHYTHRGHLVRVLLLPQEHVCQSLYSPWP